MVESKFNTYRESIKDKEDPRGRKGERKSEFDMHQLIDNLIMDLIKVIGRVTSR